MPIRFHIRSHKTLYHHACTGSAGIHLFANTSVPFLGDFLPSVSRTLVVLLVLISLT